MLNKTVRLDTFKDIWELISGGYKIVLTTMFRYLQGYMGTVMTGYTDMMYPFRYLQGYMGTIYKGVINVKRDV